MARDIPQNITARARNITVILLFVILALNLLYFEVPETKASNTVTNLYILNIEVTQAIQCLDQSNGYTSCPDNSLELDSDKWTAVRVYIGHDGSSPGADPLSPILKDVQVDLLWGATHTPDLPFLPSEQDSKSFDVPCSTNLNKLRNDSRGSVNFIIPPEKLGKPKWKKLLYINASVVAPPSLSESNLNDNSKDIQLFLYPHDTLKVTWIPVEYKPKNPLSPISNKFVNMTVAGSSDWLMKATYPMPVKYSWGGFLLVYDKRDIRNPLGSDDLLNMLSYIITNKKMPGPLVAWLPKGANQNTQIYGTGQNFPGDGVAWVIEDYRTPEQNNVTLAHETGHTQGLDHPDEYGRPAEILEVGFDIATQSALPGSTYDYMKSNAPAGWMSPYNWDALEGFPVNVQPPTAKSTSFSAQLEPPSEMKNPVTSLGTTTAILVSGMVSKDGTSGELDPLYRHSSEGPFPVSNPSGQYCLDFETLAGTILSSHRFDVSFTSCAYPTKDTAGFFFDLPFPATAERLVLRCGTTVLAERSASEHVPDLIITAPLGGEVVNGVTTFSWVGDDQDGDALNYAVLYSPDGGNSLFPIAINIEGSSLEIDSTLMAGGDSAMIRVIATDGWNTAMVDSPLFEVTKKPPIVFIRTPSESARFHQTDDIILGGGGQDVEDGELDGESLSWTSNRDGDLGTGSLCFIEDGTLSLGWHVITLTATDSDGQTATTNVEIFVGLPVAHAGGPYYTSEGIPVTLDASNSYDPIGDPLTYAWDLDNDGQYDDATGVTTTFTMVGQDGVFPIGLRVAASDGSYDTDMTNVFIDNVAPSISLSSDTPKDEGSTATVTGLVTDPGWLDPLTATIDWGDGSPPETITGTIENVEPDATLSFSVSHVYGDNGDFMVQVYASDDDTTASTSIMLQIDNVAPTAEIDTSGAIMVNGVPTFIAHVGESLDFSGRSQDPGSDDLSLSWNWDDGPPVPDVTTMYLVNPPNPDPFPSPSVQPRDVTDTALHAFSGACVYEVTFSAEDDDGGTALDTVNVIITGNEGIVRSSGYWMHEYSRKGRSHFDETTLECYLNIVGYMSQVFNEEVDASTFEDAFGVLFVRTNWGTMEELFDRQLLAVWLNFASGSLDYDEMFDLDGDGVSETSFADVVANAEAVRLDPSSTRMELEEQKNILERINTMY